MPSKKDHMTFRIEVAEYFLSKNKSSKSVSIDPSKSIRFDGSGHLVDYAGGKQGRCADCQKNSTFTCIKCLRFLHPKCFVSYHTK